MRKIRFVLALLPPFLAATIQFYFWGFISPLIWFLFYPAVFFSAWIGGLVTGLVSTCISIIFAFYFFIDPNFQTSAAGSKIFITMGTFLIMGILFSILLGRLRYLNAVLSQELQQRNISHTQEIQYQEKKFRALIDNSADIINLYNEDFKLIYLSPSYERITGFTPKERIESVGLQFVHRDDIEKSKKIMQQTLENPGIPISFQNRLLHKNGNYIWVEGTITNLLHDLSLNAIVSNFRDITERKKSEEIITRLALIVEFSSDPIIGVDLGGIITSWNQAAENFFQYTKEEVVGKSIKIIVPEERYGDGDFVLGKIKEGGKVLDYETIRVKKNKSIVDISLSVSPVKDSIGKIIGASAFVRDITDRKKMEKALVESEERYRLIMQSVTDYIVVLNKDLRVDYINHVTKEARIEDVIGSEWLKWIYEVDRSSIIECFHYTRETEKPSESEYRVSSSIGHERTFNLKIYSIPNSEGKLVLVSAEITDRKKTEQALVKSEAKYRSIMESVADNIVVLDKDMRIIYINHVSPGLKPEDVHGSLWLDWLEESDKPIALYAIAQTIFQNVPVETEFRAIGPFEEMTTFNVKFAKIPGEEQHIVLVAKDITERKKTELEIHRLHSELEERVIERTRQLAESNKELEAFSYSVSHDLRAPLRAVNGYTNILLEDYLPNLDSEGQRICNVISNEATRMGQLIDDLLSYSRLSRTEMEYTRIDMRAMAERVFNEIVVNQGNSIEFILGNLPFATGDTVLIRQVWFNLLSNAIKFTSKEKNPRIEVSAKETEKENIYSVADNGAGFDMKYSNKLFGVFQRLHTESEFEGTGVGLAIVKRSIMRNNGRVWAEGQINKGATLYFALPKSNKQL